MYYRFISVKYFAVLDFEVSNYWGIRFLRYSLIEVINVEVLTHNKFLMQRTTSKMQKKEKIRTKPLAEDKYKEKRNRAYIEKCRR